MKNLGFAIQLMLDLNYHTNMIGDIMNCACCGSEMMPDHELQNVLIYECKGCGLTNSKLKANCQ